MRLEHRARQTERLRTVLAFLAASFACHNALRSALFRLMPTALPRWPSAVTAVAAHQEKGHPAFWRSLDVVWRLTTRVVPLASPFIRSASHDALQELRSVEDIRQSPAIVSRRFAEQDA